MRIREAATRLGYYGIPFALAVGGTVEYLLEDVPASLWLTLPLLYAALLPLLFRRRFPFAAPLAALGILVLESAVNGRAVTQPATPLFLGIFCFALFAAYNSELRAVTGAMVGLAAIALVEADSPKATNVLAYFFIFVLALIGWSGGLGFRRRAQNELELRDRAGRHGVPDRRGIRRRWEFCDIVAGVFERAECGFRISRHDAARGLDHESDQCYREGDGFD